LDKKKIRDENDLKQAEREIQNDLNNLAAIIQAATQITTSQNDDENDDDDDNESHRVPKKSTIDEDDDTSRQATQNYDLLDNEQEVCIQFLFSFLCKTSSKLRYSFWQ